MTDEEKNEASGPGEAVLDEPTAHALDPETDPNTEWEQKAVDQLEGKSADSGDQEEAEEDAGGDSDSAGSGEPS